MRRYEEHRRCGQFGFGLEEDVSVTYPSLVTAARQAPSRRGPAEPPPGDEGEGAGGGI
ncbi:MAG TPA: hypothetical protein VFS00_18030 [Polyangiaceae bacterium]|nr:hypothetical protein [Polyangiaceae bacterium]